MNQSIFKQLKDLNERLQKPGFSWHHDDYFCLKEALPEIIERHLSSKSSGRDGAWFCEDCGKICSTSISRCIRCGQSRR